MFELLRNALVRQTNMFPTHVYYTDLKVATQRRKGKITSKWGPFHQVWNRISWVKLCCKMRDERKLQRDTSTHQNLYYWACKTARWWTGSHISLETSQSSFLMRQFGNNGIFTSQNLKKCNSLTAKLESAHYIRFCHFRNFINILALFCVPIWAQLDFNYSITLISFCLHVSMILFR